MKILVTGAAGFIGSALTLQLLVHGDEVIGIDNHNDYYDPALKEARLARYSNHPAYTHIRGDLTDRALIEALFSEHKPQTVINLAAQAGVRFSAENPLAYIDSNLVGFTNILEGCRHHQVQHLIYASSSSVYGANTNVPFSVHDNVDHPISLYAATKKANELMAHAYSHLYQLPTTGLRFFTVYGPWDRPDMALQTFTRAILAKRPINVFNQGKHRRDFTYIDDVTECIIQILAHPPQANNDWDSNHPDPASSNAPWRVYNIGNNHTVELMDYIGLLAEILGMEPTLNFLPRQPGDMPATSADIEDLVRDFGYRPTRTLRYGLERFVEWYKAYYQEPGGLNGS